MNLVDANRRSEMRFNRAIVVFVAVAVVAIVIAVAAALITWRFSLPPATATIVVLLPLPANTALLVMMFRTVTKLDEFKKRVHLEGVLFAFLTTLLAIFVFCSLRTANLVGPLHGSYVLWFMIVSYAVGYVLALRRYR